MTVEEFFAEYETSYLIFEAVCKAVDLIGPAEIRVSKSQVAFRYPKTFAIVWIPAKYLRGKTAPLVLTLLFRVRDPSPRWKEIVEPKPGRFTHHLELYSPGDVDDQVRRWLVDAFVQVNAGKGA